mgnify:CR=1 FL=1
MSFLRVLLKNCIAGIVTAVGWREFRRSTVVMFINQGCNSERKQKSNLKVTDRKVMEIPHNHISNADYDVK